MNGGRRYATACVRAIGAMRDRRKLEAADVAALLDGQKDRDARSTVAAPLVNHGLVPPEVLMLMSRDHVDLRPAGAATGGACDLCGEEHLHAPDCCAAEVPGQPVGDERGGAAASEGVAR